MFLGIEIGGTKLQLGVGSGDGGPLAALERLTVEPSGGAQAIRRQIAEAGGRLIHRYGVSAIGIGFGGPVEASSGQTIISHQVDGWKDFQLAQWCRRTFGLPAVVANDSDTAGLAEATFGAGQGHKVVFYANVGSGIGGALVIDGEIYRGGRGMAVEPGHMRPGLQFDRPDQTVESIASGWAITAAAQARLAAPITRPPHPPTDEDRPLRSESVRRQPAARQEAEQHDVADLLDRCDGRPDRLTTKIVAQAAAEGNQIAREIFDHACEAFGWAIAQMITLVAPNIVVIGGGVSLAGEQLFLAPVRSYVRRYVFPPLAESSQIVAAKLGEEVVVHGAVALASGL